LDWLTAIGLGVGSYLLGSVPTAYLVVKILRGEDIRELGSKNVGALNAYHQVGVLGSLLVLSVDSLKGALAVLLPQWLGAPPWTVFLTATLVVLGHNWPVVLGFRGGKGVATILGISLAMFLPLTLISLVPTLIVTLLTRNVVTGVGVGFIVFNTLTVATTQDAAQVALCLFLTVLASGTYVAANWGRITGAIKNRDLRGLFHDQNWNP
jgi:glycerol-3-phosphate acyltransferase PlsY